MATNRTFTMIKPDATGAGHTGKIIDRIIEAGFTIKAMKWTQLSIEDAQAFYAVHAERPFYGELTEYMSSGPIVAAILEKDNAVADFRELIGATNPAEAAPGTIRADPIAMKTPPLKARSTSAHASSHNQASPTDFEKPPIAEAFFIQKIRLRSSEGQARTERA